MKDAESNNGSLIELLGQIAELEKNKAELQKKMLHYSNRLKHYEEKQRVEQKKTHERIEHIKRLEQDIQQSRKQEKQSRLKAEDQQRQKKFLEDLINAIDDPVFVQDDQHHWTLLNDSACKLMGSSRKDLIGKIGDSHRFGQRTV